MVCMKKLGGLMVVVSDENCLADEQPHTEQACERPPCQSQWYMADWTPVSIEYNSLKYNGSP